MAKVIPSRGFRTRAIAIAAAGSVALGGLAVVSPTGSVIAAPAAYAQTAFSANDVTYNGLFKQDGTKIDGPIRSSGVGTEGGKSVTAGSPAYVSLKVNLANVSSGDTLHVQTKTTYTLPGGNEAKVSAGPYGLGFASTEPGIPVTAMVDEVETRVGTLNTRERGISTVTFNKGVEEVRNGSVELKLNVKVSAVNVVGEGEDGVITGSSDILVSANNTGYTKAGSVAKVNMYLTWIEGAFNNDPYTYTNHRHGKITQDGTVHVTRTRVTLPGGTSGTATLTPSRDKKLPNYVPWVLEDNVTITPVMYVHAEGSTSLQDAEVLTGMEEINAKFKNVRTSVSQNGQTLTMSSSGVPENGQMSFIITGPNSSGDHALASYLPNGYLYGDLTYKNSKTNETFNSTSTRVYSVPGALNSLPGGTGEGFTRTADVTPSIAGQGKGVGIDTPAPIAGQEATFLFQVKNTGNSALAAPVVTLPSGKRVVVKDTAINPGTTGTVSVKYKVPKDAQNLNFKVEFAGATLSPTDDFNFIIGKPNPLAGGVTVNPDGSITIDGPDGPVTLAPQDAVDELKKDLKDANDKVTDLQKQLDDEKRKGDADREKIAKLETELEKAKTDLAATKEALKRAQDAADKAQESANNAQETANQALKDLATERERVNDLTERANKAEKDLKDARERVAALEKENDDQQAQIDQARKDVKDLQDKAKKLRTDLEAAKKRVTTLEEQNKKQQGQIDALVKENKTQQSEIDKLKAENKKQQGQIDGLRKDLSNAEDRISTLETELALTRLELAAVSERLGVVEDRLNTGLGKCVGTIGGSLAALVPAVLLASQFAGGSHMAQVDKTVADFQRQLGAFNPEVAKFVDHNRGAIAAGFAGLGVLALLLLPETCGDASLGEAVAEPLSSAREERKAARENGETPAGSSRKGDAETGAEGTRAGSSSNDKEAVAAQ